MQYFESAACCSDGRAMRRIVDAEHESAWALARELADLGIVAVHDESRVSRQRLATALRHPAATCSSSP